ncbi:hypothetical protein P170DRAFT_430558 [Aspergillus steynii IBT 23096]|uniref:Uncharacterized protein n=1 Tax=Aspergillus steynii IBT 23096 TaxID=1392250 RepID=A0A2I2FS92_9EURO|nr:uncharacterized protein P170DRAFT_430558 [Aspergillus steynii IBT 23096]PLB43476.1 hypothetical protein P170DRAFT_430558 [Aspergillus steynii IBT 23096]
MLLYYYLSLLLGSIHITNTKSFSLNSPALPNSNLAYEPYHWPRKIYGFFVNHSRHLQAAAHATTDDSSNDHQHSIIGSGWLPDRKKQDRPIENGSGVGATTTSTQRRFPAIYALMRHLQRTDRVWVPVALLFVMSWLAVMAMGVVECVGMCWEKSMQRQGRRREGLDGRVLFDEGLLEEVVIEAVPMDEDDEDNEAGGDEYGMLKKA